MARQMISVSPSFGGPYVAIVRTAAGVEYAVRVESGATVTLPEGSSFRFVGMVDASAIAPAPDEGSSSEGPAEPTVEPLHVYGIDSTHYVVVFGVDMVLNAGPSWTFDGVGIVEIDQFYGQNALAVGLADAVVAGSMTVTPGGDAVVSAGSGLKVAAGTYPVEEPPALTNGGPPGIDGNPTTTSSLYVISEGTWTGYGSAVATYEYQWQFYLSGDENPVFQDIVGATENILYLDNSLYYAYVRCGVRSKVGNTYSDYVYSSEVGPITNPVSSGGGG